MPKQYYLSICYDTLDMHSYLQTVRKQYQLQTAWSPGMLLPGCALVGIALTGVISASRMNRMVTAQNKVTRTWEAFFFVWCSLSFYNLWLNSLLCTANKEEDAWNPLCSRESNKGTCTEKFPQGSSTFPPPVRLAVWLGHTPGGPSAITAPEV